MNVTLRIAGQTHGVFRQYEDGLPATSPTCEQAKQNSPGRYDTRNGEIPEMGVFRTPTVLQ